MRNQDCISRPPKSAEDPQITNALTALDTIRMLITTLTVALEATQAMAAGEVVFVGSGINFYNEVERFETQLITKALHLAHGSQREAARLLGLNATTLHAKIRTLNIDWKAASKSRLGRTRKPGDKALD